MIRSLVLTALMLVVCGLMGCGDEANSPQQAKAGAGDDVVKAQSLQAKSRFPLINQSSSLTVDGEKLTYVGSQQCSSCHGAEATDWQNSHHDLAMQEATAETVLGDFNNTSFDYFGIVSQFSRQGDDFHVKTDGPDGQLTDYKIAYTFGVYPLQQYLIEFPGGRLQALNIVWDSRPAEEGGQRWYHLYPDEKISSGDELHWTGINHNWNFMCADCHSTNLKKNYDLTTQSYRTSWSEVDVGCEACHGPASKHLQWANSGAAAGDDSKPMNYGFPVAYTEREGAMWQPDARTGLPVRHPAKSTHTEIESCARCHSRRSSTSSEPDPAAPLLQHHRLSLLTPGLYHPDGQIDGEVYVYGSFLQSKMYHAGVTCSDCHNPHSLELRAPDNALCGQCHIPAKYDRQEHHFHPAGTDGAQCVNCHMPQKTYMGVDARRDHSFRVPRPDLSQQLGTPNACTNCHTDKDAAWATQALQQRGKTLHGSEYAIALQAGREGRADAGGQLMELVADDSLPEIVRATAVAMLPAYASQQTAPLLQAVAQGNDTLLTYALSQELESIAANYRPVFAVPLLYDPNSSTRGLAARSLVGLSLQQFPPRVLEKNSEALIEYEKAELYNADRPESLTNLGDLYSAQGQTGKAASYYRQAIKLAPYFTPAYINLADFYYRGGDELRGQAVLREGIATVRDPAPIQHALGLSLVRSKQPQLALEQLRLAAAGEQAPARYSYVYGVALNSLGQPDQAVEFLQRALQRYPGDREIVSALYAMYRDQGDAVQAERYRVLLQGN
ncbi:tetratricopeptide repeat protein [Pseudomaricurvus sp. HS19]|uniref:tetratricopeptide repeat protein n=1 Tax=Pseudomaricurvus sp. HS19 TaxID=2692626 RepID=UPI0019269F43|nr:tetratricopeptide repeat protein [Pseudomaricurvus sp. HS19]